MAEPTLVGRVIAARPSFALTASYELLTRQVRRSTANIGTPDQRARQPQRRRPGRAGRKPTGGLTLVSQHQRDGSGRRASSDLARQAWHWAWPTGTSTGRCPAAGRLLMLIAGKSGGAGSSSVLAWPAGSTPKARGTCDLALVTG